jgi:hypothetical protein
MPHPRIIQALELIHDARLSLERIAKQDGTHDYWIVTLQLEQSEDELLRHIAEIKRAEQATGGAR